MRSQSSIEFLTTYSFLFLLLGVAVGVIIFVAGAPSASVPSQCNSFAGPTCNFVQIYANQSAGYALVTFTITNSQGVPVNITGANVIIRSVTATGFCTPTFLYPGQSATCAANVQGTLGFTSLVQGFYTLNARFCNSGVSRLSQANCTFETVSYSGSFASVPVRTRAIVFSVIASQGPGTQQQLPFSVINNAPLQPNNYSILQNGFWATNVTSGTLAYAFAGTGAMLGGSYLGYTAKSYPQSLSSLSNPAISCVAPYNSVLSVASTTLYMSSSVTSSVSIETGGGMLVFYRAAPAGNSWSFVPGSNGWSTAYLSQNQIATTFAANSVALNTGFYNLEVMWTNTCGTGGGQVLKMTSLPN